MKALYFSVSLLLFGVIFGTASGCVVDFPDELPYACETDADCGGSPHVCASLPDGRHYCCHPDPELCNLLDDDCNGVADDIQSEEACYTGPEATRNVGACHTGKPTCGSGGNIVCTGEVVPAAAELCNGKDDNCNGTVDEGFDFQTGRNNCGRCDVVCPASDDCVAGQCVTRKETACGNGLDDDGDTLTDCADSDCNTQSCGAGCTCLSGRKAETGCDNDVDDDGDAQKDCADTDCDSRSCGAGCVCTGGKRGEGDCNNGVNDDAPEDALTDCADPDCTSKSCGDGCVCQGGFKTEDLCDDNLDNDGDTKIDCADLDCQGKFCGVGCVCGTPPNKKEVVCSDKLDNDSDTKIDCTDTDCNGLACTPNEPDTNAKCVSSLCTELNCVDRIDNDKDNLTDCADTDCDGKQCITGEAGALCVASACQETICNDAKDNDQDGKTNCADPDCDGKLCRKQGSQSFFCASGVCP